MERESEIVGQAGRLGVVTVATNMAGRGTDILLGGNPAVMARIRIRDALAEELLSEEDFAAVPKVVCRLEMLMRFESFYFPQITLPNEDVDQVCLYQGSSA